MADIVFSEFRDRHPGEDMLVCGCGESLREFQVPEDLVTIGVNDVGRVVDPDYLVVLNSEGQFSRERFQYIRNSRADAVFTQFANLPVPDGKRVILRLGQYGGTDLANPDALPYTRNSPYVAICLAVYMGARRIGLIGVDFSDRSIYGPAARHPLTGQLQRIDGEYARLVSACTGLGVELVNLSPASRLTSIPKADSAGWLEWHARRAPARRAVSGLRVVSYATTPVAGVPAILSRCISSRTAHTSRCVWARNSYGKGFDFTGDVQWNQTPQAALELLEQADLLIVHNGFVAPAHQRLLASKPTVTMAHNYAWNVDTRWVNRGLPGVVVGQYQATLPEFKDWALVPNPVPYWEPDFSPAPKSDRITIAYTPSGRHERYAADHRLFWHAKGFETTMRVLEKLALTKGIAIETTARGQMSHRQALRVKQHAHIVIDECVTGSYHRNSLEGLAAGAVVVNGVGLIPEIADAFRRCTPSAEHIPFVYSTLAGLEGTLCRLIEQGAAALAEQGRQNRLWMERHWRFEDQWPLFWASSCRIDGTQYRAKPRVDSVVDGPPASTPARPLPDPGAAQVTIAGEVRQNPDPGSAQVTAAGDVARNPDPGAAQVTAAGKVARNRRVSVIVPHGGVQRLPLLQATLANLRQCKGVHEIVLVEMGSVSVASEAAARWADQHLFIEKSGPFERATALNAGQAVAQGELLLWHDNDLLTPPDLIELAAHEALERQLDFLVPYSSIRYLSASDTAAVLRGEGDWERFAPVRTFQSARHVVGGMGLVRRDFVLRDGGLIEGFRGWGGEDTAFMHKVRVLGTWGSTRRANQSVAHLYHPESGGYRRESLPSLHPHYPANVALCRDVLGIRDAQVFRRRHPPVPPAIGILKSGVRSAAAAESSLPVFTYWEGPEPAWIAACLRTLAAAAPGLCVLTPDTFLHLWDRDRDIDLKRLCIAHRADFIRAFLLMRFGGLWVDADCVALKPLAALIEDFGWPSQFAGYRERSGLVSNNFMAVPPGSEIAKELYQRICATLRSRRALGWTSIGSEPLNAILEPTRGTWTEIPRERIAPICWSEAERFFARRSDADHAREFDANAGCYMLSHSRINQYAKSHPTAELLAADSFLSYLLSRATQSPSRALQTADDRQENRYERIFGAHLQPYREYGDESLSGPGSTLAQTANLRRRLPLLLAHLGVTSLLDAPCGDFNWMKHVDLGAIEYTGVDVQREIIALNRVRYANARRRFERLDVTGDPLPAVDAILCRDLLTHLSFEEVMAVIKNFQRSGSRYLLTSTYGHDRARANAETADGNWRPLDLTRSPFNFPAPLARIVEGCTEAQGAYSDKSIGVWRLDDLAGVILDASKIDSGIFDAGALDTGALDSNPLDTEVSAVTTTQGPDDGRENKYERIFSAHVQLYRQYGDESLSGPGSTRVQTANLRRRLPVLLADLGITSLLDAPCGDFNWMNHVDLAAIEYTGVDVQREIIALNRVRYASARRRFERLDVTCDPLPAVDAIFCRDLLTHLSYEEAIAVIANFRRSGSRFLLTTTYGHDRARANTDSADGRWRPLDLTRQPFNFTAPLARIVEGCTEAKGVYSDKSIAVWRLDDLSRTVRDAAVSRAAAV